MQHEAIRYCISPYDPRAHLFEVSCTVRTPASTGQRFRLPSWIPGSYLIRDFARHFVRTRARDEQGPIDILKEGKDVWRAAPGHGAVTVTAYVYAYDLSVRGAYLDQHRGFFNGSCVFLCPEGLEDVASELEIIGPAGNEYAHWRVATAMPRRDAAPYGFGHYGAANYDELIDHPVEMGAFSLASFTAGGAVHDIAIAGRHHADMTRLCNDLQRVCAWQCRLFDDAHEAPFDRYVFLVNAVGDGYGGLEHRASTSLICKRDELPEPAASEISDDYRTFLGLASHEYFHSWNVKRIKPAAFSPYDLTRESYTRLLWAFEGITSYYDDLALARSGVLPIDDYLELLGRTITSVLRTPGRHLQSVAESSFDAWIKFYRPDENTPNAVVSYYAKGSLVALALDLTLRRHKSSLDALMRVLWQRYGRTGTGVPEDALPGIAAELAGISLDDFFARYIHGTCELPLAELLREVGIRLNLRAQQGSADRGGKPGSKDAVTIKRSWLGVKLASGSEPRLEHVLREGPAERAGLAAGDVLVAIDSLRASVEALEKLLTRGAPGDVVRVLAFRRDELLEVTCILEAAPQDTSWLEFDDSASSEALARRAQWLGGASDASTG